MRAVKLFIAAALLTLVAACGGGGGGGSSPAAPAAPASTPKVAGHVCVLQHCWILVKGDSTYWGNDNDDPDNLQQGPGVGQGMFGRTNPTPAQLDQQRFDSDPRTAGKVTVVDQSIPGSSFKRSLLGIAPEHATFAAVLAAETQQFDIIATNDEINDQYGDGDSLSEYLNYATAWIAAVKSVGAVPLFLEPNPTCQTGYNTATANAMVDEMEALFPASGGFVADNTAAWESVTTPQPWNLALMSSDCIHPSNAGYAFSSANRFPQMLAAVLPMLGY